ncbi:hypothetical protein [Streptomyces sp. JJ36]|uniref:hypothetical protein n=1 Tax=Streptomyces sp. JJ36 TaxID=2736645 RepID=UPI001F249614|nr:hypothetical protein [Streptomyces sp. JJ36]MCF6522070.1 hypothetical protein [Streptomyces sp. JJ36]
MLQSTFTKVAVCAAGGAVAAMAAAGPAAATAPTAPVPGAPNAPMSTELLPEQGGGKVHKGFTKRRTAIKSRPSRNSRTIGWIPRGRVIHLKCKVRGEFPDRFWFKLAKRPGWVSSRTVVPLNHVPFCRWRPPMDDMQSQDFNELPADMQGAMG